jgi:hypothetical protein
MFVVPSGVRVATRATGSAPASGARRAVAARCTGAQRATKRVERNGRGGPGVNAGLTGRGSASEVSLGAGVPAPDRAPMPAPMTPAATAPIAHATSEARLTL